MLGKHAFHPDIWSAVLALVMASLAIMGSPGPSTISATAVGAAYGFRRSLGYVGGLMAGTAVVLLAVAAGVVAILLAVPYGASILTIGSAVYIGYLALRIAAAPPLADRGDQAVTPAFAGGFLLAVANPKAYVAIAAVFAGVSLFEDDRLLDAAAKTMVLGMMIVLIHLFWLLAGVSLSRFLRNALISRIVNILLAGVLIATALFALMG